MDKAELIEHLKNLAEGKTNPQEWLDWWHNNEENISEYKASGCLKSGEVLRLKPKFENESIWRAALISQKGAVEYLQAACVPFSKSDLYEKKWAEDFESFCRESEERDKKVQNEFKEKHPKLTAQYPKFAKRLIKVFSKWDKIKNGVSEEEIKDIEMQTGCALKDDVKTLFYTLSEISFEGLNMGISQLSKIELNNKTYYRLGEYFKYADGDLLLLTPDECTVYYYAHEENNVKKLCKNISELMEKELAGYLKNR